MFFSVIRKLLGSKRALYLVNTSEEFSFFDRSQRMIIVCVSILYTYYNFHSIICVRNSQTYHIISEKFILIFVLLINFFCNEY